MLRISKISLACVVLLAIVASCLISRRMYVHQQSLREAARYNVAWGAGQALAEQIRLQLALTRVPLGGSIQEVRLRYDIFLNRLHLMEGGDFAAFLAAHPRHQAAMRHADATMSALLPLLDSIGVHDTAADAARRLAQETADLVALSATANRYGGERIAADEAVLFELHWMYFGLSAVLIVSGISLIMILSRRMTELRSTKESLEQTTERLTQALVEADAASRAKATFLATMSHEIRTPLNAMLGLTTSLLDEIRTGSQRRLLETIRDAGDSLLRLLNDVLDFSKLDAGRMTFEDTVFSPSALTRNVAGILNARANAKSISLFVLTGPGLPSGVLGDPGRIEQVLINLISNAVKFTAHGHVTIQIVLAGTAPGAATIIWRVSDTGIGIPSNRLDNLFAEFMQADNSITRRFGGTGLGLAISKRLIDQMNGSITVESTSDVGTTFTVRLTLPLASENPVEMKGTDDGDDVAARFDAFTVRIGRKLRILFVEDNPTNQFVATQLLKGFNVHLDMAGNGLEALDSVSRFTHDLICMDMRMPEMDGLEATRQIRRMGGRMAEIPIIALTANAFKEDIDACMASGMNRFVAKPVCRDILLGAMLAELSASMTDDDRPGLIPVDPPALDLAAFDELFDMIGDDGVVEMVGIFETETRRRLSRLAAGDQDATTMSREMHTLKGAAGTVAAPYLAALGRTLEHALAGGIAPSETDLRAIEAGLNAFLAAVASNAGTRAEAA